MHCLAWLIAYRSVLVANEAIKFDKIREMADKITIYCHLCIHAPPFDALDPPVAADWMAYGQ